MISSGELVIVELDGVLALIEHRLHHLYNETGEKDWQRFYAACGDDMPNLPLIERLNRAHNEGAQIIIITSRSATARNQTLAWLSQWQIGYDALWMRPARDYGPAAQFKEAVLDQHYQGIKIRRLYESVQHLDVAQLCEQRTIPCTLVAPNQGNGESREQFELKVVDHPCGHTTLYPFYGDDDFSWEERTKQFGQGNCPLCQADERKREQKQKASKARYFAKERGLPPLEGSERQAEWAESIRLNAFGAIDKVQQWVKQVNAQAEEEDPDHWQSVKQGINRSIEYLEEQVDARWWIDHRQAISNNLNGGRALLSSIAEELGYY